MRKGIDVSYHQGLIDWIKVKASGIEFAIIRAGYGKKTVDKYFIENICGATTVGLKVGVYWFLYAKNEQEAIANAEKFHNTIALYKENITLKVWCDYEYDSDNNSIKNGVVQTKESRTRIVKAFNHYLEEKGWDVGVYANPDYIKNKFLDLSEYPLWLAYYNNNENNAKKYNPIMWQYSSKGTVAGIKGNVDMNYCYVWRGKSINEVAREVLAGVWGNGEERRKKLIEAGYDYKTVQKVVNELMGEGTKNEVEIAKEVLLGEWGTGEERKRKLTEAGYDYVSVQKMVNELLR